MKTDLPVIALIPAKGASRRVLNKNTRPFHGGMCLVEWKIEVLKRCPTVDAVFVSSDDEPTLDMALAHGVAPLPRDPALCTDHVPIGTVIPDVLTQTLTAAGVPDALIYWAHPTAPFVRPETITDAIADGLANPDQCVVGMERTQDFFWTETAPLNYDPSRQPRSQDLPPLYRVAGGIHIGRASEMIRHRSHTFGPRRFIELSRIESLDINTPDDWAICTALAATVFPALLNGK